VADNNRARHQRPDASSRRLLHAQIVDLATGVGLAIRTARSLKLPVEPGVREGREALVRWAVLLEELLP
jgi:hypothetical protein